MKPIFKIKIDPVSTAQNTDSKQKAVQPLISNRNGPQPSPRLSPSKFATLHHQSSKTLYIYLKYFGPYAFDPTHSIFSSTLRKSKSNEYYFRILIFNQVKIYDECKLLGKYDAQDIADITGELSTNVSLTFSNEERHLFLMEKLEPILDLLKKQGYEGEVNFYGSTPITCFLITIKGGEAKAKQLESIINKEIITCGCYIPPVKTSHTTDAPTSSNQTLFQQSDNMVNSGPNNTLSDEKSVCLTSH